MPASAGRERREPVSLRSPFEARWSVLGVPAAAAAIVPDPADAAWLDIDAPGSVAAVLRSAGRWTLDGPARRFDAEDWWFRARFDAPAPAHRLDGVGGDLVFGGLAGHCSAWLNGEPLLESRNMHLSHRVVPPPLQAHGNELLLRFASLDRWLDTRRPRPRWRAPMVENPQLRWVRATLLGRTPGWSPPAAAVGPWRPVEWLATRAVDATPARWRLAVDGPHGRAELDLDLIPRHAGARVGRAEVVLRRGRVEHRAELVRTTPDGTHFAAVVEVPDVARWWPHTHGEPALYEAWLSVDGSGGRAPLRVDLGRIGFRTIGLDRAGDGFALHVNGVPVFCRGACWTPLDPVALQAPAEAVRDALGSMRDAGMNMVRVCGSMVYEDEPFLDACDALGILVWQDFMFANMDYPDDDAAFGASVREEARQQLARWQGRPALAVLCGNSEGEQQAAMWGAPRTQWSQPLFDRDLAELVRAARPDVPYWPSSAHGGAFPHQPNAGTCSYYGVGAYRRPLDDARRSAPRFATECLAFANVPPPSTVARMPGGATLRVHQPAWSARAPRDLGAGWDFEDVRDHYLALLYRVDPVALRSREHERYLALSRALGAEVVAAAFAEWRRPGSTCGGALVWFLRDLWAGAGWGLLDDQGEPKAAFHGARRAMAPVALFVADEGLNGLDLHLVNDPAEPLDATIVVALYRDDGLCLHRAERQHRLAAHAAVTLPATAWLDGFVDLTRAHGFGPGEHALLVATLRDTTGRCRAEAFHFPDGLPSARAREIGLTARDVRVQPDGSALVTLATRDFAQSIHFDVPGYIAEDEYFHLAPGASRDVRLRPIAPTATAATALPRGRVQALNAHASSALGPSS